ncbi:MAG: elongation factor G [Candidatus Zixiibacteriota bacterium]
MKVYQSEDIRNIGLVGQRGTGKTTLADALAFVTGASNRQGSVDNGSSISDFTEREIDRKASLSTAALALTWRDAKINVLDMPGHPDFIGEVVAGLRVVGNACIVLDAATGVDAGAAASFEIASRDSTPVMFFINKVERENTDWEAALSDLKGGFGSRVAPVNIPVVIDDHFRGLIDLLHMKEISIDSSGTRIESDIPSDHMELAKKWRENLIEQVAETDDAYLEKFFEQGALSDDEIKDGLRKGSVSGQVFPTLFGSAATRAGVQLLADFAVEYLPAPVAFPPLKLKKTGSEETVEVRLDPTSKPVIYIYKIFSEGQAGDLFYFRVLTGKLSPGAEFSNQRNAGGERVGQVYALIGRDRKEVAELNSGDLGAVAKLKGARIGDTLAPKDLSVMADPPEYDEPVMDVAVRPSKKGEEEKMGEALNRLSVIDPSFKLVHDARLKQILLFGQGNTQLDILVDRIKSEYGVDVELDRPRVPYRETIRGKTEVQHRYKKQSGGRGQFGDVHLRLEPLTRGEGFEFVNKISGGVIPTKFIPSVEKGVREALGEGQLSGSEVVDVRATVFYGSFHAVDSSDMAFKLAAMMGFKEGFMQCKPTILEPIHEVEILAPDDHTGDVMGDISSRRGKILGMEPNGKMQVIKAHIPQAELYKYTVDLRSMTQGQGRFKRRFSHYEEAPADVQVKIKAEYAASKNDN